MIASPDRLAQVFASVFAWVFAEANSSKNPISGRTECPERFPVIPYFGTSWPCFEISFLLWSVFCLSLVDLVCCHLVLNLSHIISFKSLILYILPPSSILACRSSSYEPDSCLVLKTLALYKLS